MIRAETAHLQLAANTHPGMTGKNNEDRYAVSAYRLGPGDPTPVVLAVLCDGIGGHRAGEVAAEMAVDTISQVAAESSGRQPVRVLREAIQAASDRIYAMAQSDPEQRGMGATCACAWVSGDQLYTATIGDSRIYLVRSRSIHQVSTDHTWIQEALENGMLRPEDVRGHPNAHVIRRFLGSPTPPEVDFRLRVQGSETDAQAEQNQGTRLAPGDQILLCSDGLTDLVDSAEILAALLSSPPEAAIQTLIDLANARGGHDNITVVVLTVPGHETPVVRAAKGRFPWGWAALGCAGVALVAGAVALFGLWSLGMLPFFSTATQTPRPTGTLPPAIRTILPENADATPTLIPLGASPSPTTGEIPGLLPTEPGTATATPMATAAPANTPAPLPTQTP